MRLASTSLCCFWAALTLVSLFTGCERPEQLENSASSPASPVSEHAHKSEFQQYLVNLAGDAARWKGRLLAISPHGVCTGSGTAAAIDENIAGIVKNLDAVQARIQTLAQQETLGGDIELLTGLQAISEDTTRLESLLPCPSSNGKQRPAPMPGPASTWLDQVREIQQQAKGHAARLQTQSLALARSARPSPGEEGNRWQWKDLADLVRALAWPAVLAIGLLMFRRPLSRFFEQFAGRISKLSLFEVAVELATVPTAPAPWSDPAVYAGAELFGGAVTTTTIMTLFERIGDDTVWNYLIVDLEDGRRWLESRLYLFTTVLQEMGGLRCVIFVQSNQDYYRRFLGMAEPTDVRRVLGDRYWWFRSTLYKSTCAALAQPVVNLPPADLDRLRTTFLYNPQPTPFDPSFNRFESSLNAWITQLEPLPKVLAEAISREFVLDPLMRAYQDPSNPEWSRLEPSQEWDHSYWLTMERFNRDLQSVLFDRTLSQLEDTPETPAEERTGALLRRPVPFVALVNRRGEFQKLVDRQVLIEQVGAKLGETTGLSPAAPGKG